MPGVDISELHPLKNDCTFMPDRTRLLRRGEMLVLVSGLSGGLGFGTSANIVKTTKVL